MNKKFYLGAILLGAMTLSTGALTSCIDNDEPEGITNLRGAKAELLRAKAALELAKAETEKQNANLVAAKVKIEEAIAKQEEAIAKQEEAIAKQEEAKAKIQEAKSEQEKAAAMEAMAKAQEAQAQAEANIAWIKAQNELDLQNLKNQLLQAQNNYDKLVAEIEAAKAVLTDVQAAKLATLQAAVDAAWAAYTTQQNAVLTAMQNLFYATNNEVDVEEILRDALADAESDLAAKTAVYDELKALSENVAPTAWEARMDSLKAYSDGTNGTHKLEIAELNLKLTEIKQSEAYKTAENEDNAARRAYVTAQQLYNYLADENLNDCFAATGVHAGSWSETNKWGYYSNGTHPSVQAYTGAKKYDLQGAKIVITNPEVYSKLNALGTTGLVKDAQGNMRLQVNGTSVAYGGGEKYSNLKNAFNPSGLPQTTITTTVAGWEAALAKVNVTDEEIAADTCVANYEKAVLTADSIHKSKVEAWKKAHKTYADQKVAETVSTAKIKAAIGLYNAKIEALEAAVTEYNTTYDATLTSLYNKELEKAKISNAQTQIDATLAASPAVGGTVGSRTSLAQIDALIESSTLTDAQKTAKKSAYRTDINNQWALLTGLAISGIETAAMTAAEGAVNAEDAVIEAKAKITKADGSGILDKIKKADGGWNPTDKVYTGSYATIAKAVTDFIADAGKNSEKQTSDAVTASTTAKQESYTGVAGADAKKYITGGNNTTPTYSAVTNTMWVVTKYELDENNDYQPTKHLQVVRTKVSDAAINAMIAVELDKDKAGQNWVDASAVAFGTSGGAVTVDGTTGKVLTATGARHTELTANMIKENSGNYYDENGEQLTNWATSSLKTLVDAQKTLAEHQNLQGVNAEIASLKAKVAEAKAAMLAQIAGYTSAVNEAKAAIEPAKKAHQAKHKAAEALLKPVMAEIAKINATVNKYNALAADLQAILDAYYAINDFSYVDEDGVTHNITWGANKDFSQVAAWLKGEIKNYETAIETAEDAVATAQKDLDRWIADGEFDAVAQAQLALDNAQAILETLKTRYDFALSQLNDYVAAISK